jgi:hypothetical protein
MMVLVCSLWFGWASVALAQEEETAPSEPAAEEAAPSAAEGAAEEKAEPQEAPAEASEAEESAPEEAAGDEEAAEGNFLSRYGNHVRNTFLAGTNGIITWPADPVALTMNPTDEMRSMPGGVVTGPVTGFFAGSLLGIYRLVTGVLDIGLAPLSFFPMFSPEPRYQVIPGWEHQA